MINITEYKEKYFAEIQKLYRVEGWSTICDRPKDGHQAFAQSNMSYIALIEDELIGVLRGFTDGYITSYVVELLVAEKYRGVGVGKQLLEACHLTYPTTRIEVMGTNDSKGYYEKLGFKAHYGFRKSYM